MPTEVIRILGQVAPANTSNDIEVYTVPAGKSAVVSTLIVANQSSTAKTYRISIRPTATSLNTQHWIAYNVPISANDSTTLTLGLTMGANVRLGVQSSEANAISFNAFGTEITP
jgi:hypothetical protein